VHSLVADTPGFKSKYRTNRGHRPTGSEIGGRDGTYVVLTTMLSYFACVNFVYRYTGRIVKLVGEPQPPSAPPAAAEARA